MINIYLSDTEALSKRESLNNLLMFLPEMWRKRGLRYKNERDAYNYVQGRLLLIRGLKDLNLEETVPNIQYLKSGKPFLKGVYFSLSHTTDKVVCAITKHGEVGIDIEKQRSLNLENFRSWFTVTEWNDIEKAAEPLNRFLWYWTRKESIIKALGVNLSHLNKIELNSSLNHFEYGDRKFQLTDFDFGREYYFTLCSEFLLKEQSINIQKV